MSFPKIKIKRGLKSNLPILELGELAFTTDTQELFIGVLADPTLVSDNVLIVNFNNPIFTGQVEFTPTTLETTGTVEIDFSESTYRTQAALTGNITYTGNNYLNGRSVTIRVINGTTERALIFPAAWRFLGDKPTNIAANKIGVLTLASFGSTESDVVAAWAVEL